MKIVLEKLLRPPPTRCDPLDGSLKRLKEQINDKKKVLPREKMRNERHDDDESKGMVNFSFDSDDDVRGGFQFTGEKGELRRG